MFCSNDVSKEERPELVKKVYKWNTKEEAKQAFKELLKEKVFFSLSFSLSPCSEEGGVAIPAGSF